MYISINISLMQFYMPVLLPNFVASKFLNSFSRLHCRSLPFFLKMFFINFINLIWHENINFVTFLDFRSLPHGIITGGDDGALGFVSRSEVTSELQNCSISAPGQSLSNLPRLQKCSHSAHITGMVALDKGNEWPYYLCLEHISVILNQCFIA